MRLKRCKTEPTEEEETGSSALIENGDNEAAGECNDAAENGELQSPQAQTRWTPESTRVMLQLRFERQLDFQQRIRQKKELWSEIAAEMRRQELCDFSLTAEACDLKYRNMLQTYKKNRLKEDNGMQSLIAWEYYELFKEALTAAEEMEAAQEANDRVVPSLLCESVCEEVTNETMNDDALKGTAAATEIAKLAGPPETTEIETEDVKSAANIKPTIVNNRKRSRRAAMKTETASPPPPPVVQLPTTKPIIQELPVIVQDSVQECYTHPNPRNEAQPQLFNMKPDTCSQQPQRRRACPSFTASTPIINVPPSSVSADTHNDVTMHSIQNEPHLTSTSAPSLPLATMMHIPPLQPQPQTIQTAMPAVSQTPVTMVHPNHLHAIPVGLAPSEMRECQVFGESIGLQLAHVREPHVRAMLQFKIQELLYLAKTGKPLESVRV